jgi:probable F420-dependent oxidoreductase
MTFRFGVNCTTTSGGEWLDTARKAEDLGFDTYIAQDHFGAQLAPLSALAAAAMVTTRLRLATVVLDNDFRHPALVAKEIATLDVLSGGRAELGLGAGWLESDYTRTGTRFDSAAIRLERLEESLQICKLLFTCEQPVTFEGKHYSVRELDPLPRPVRRPPLMVGGRLKRALSLAAREADIVGISLLDRTATGQRPPTFAQKIQWVREAAGPRLPELQLHVNVGVVAITDSPAEAVQQFAARTGQSVEDALASPGALVGSVDAILEKLHAVHEQYGVGYWVVHARSMDAMVRVLARAV